MASPSEEMDITIRLTDGTKHAIHIDGTSCTVSALKLKISEELLIPVQFQKISSQAGSIIEGSEVIEKEQLTELSLVISLDDFSHVLTNARGEELRQALQILFKSCHLCKGNDGIIKSLATRLLDDDDVVRLTASQVLCQIADKGDEHVVAALASCLEHENRLSADVRRLALSVLPQFAKKGDEQFIIAVVSLCVKHSDWNVRCQALSILTQLAETGNKHATTAVISCLQDRISFIRCKALEVFLQIVENGDEHVAAVIACLEDLENDVRCAALRVLPQLAKKGDKNVIEAVVTLLEDQAWHIRCKALRTIPQLLEKGDEYENVADAVDICLQDPENDVRLAAMEVLSQLT